MPLQVADMTKIMSRALAWCVGWCVSVVVAHAHSGFVSPSDGYKPAYLTGKSVSDIEISNPSEARVIVYSHGQSRGSQVPDCRRASNGVPETLLQLEDHNTRIYYLCSKAWDGGGEKGYYVYLRVKEIMNLLKRLEELGVRKDRIVLAGHSAGGWSSLMAQSLHGSEIPNAILFAPAFAGAKSEEGLYPEWRRDARPKQVKQLESGAPLRALIFSYHGDRFEEPADLTFLSSRAINNIEVVAYACLENENQHRNHLNDCRAAETLSRIERYLESVWGGKRRIDGRSQEPQ